MIHRAGYRPALGVPYLVPYPLPYRAGMTRGTYESGPDGIALYLYFRLRPGKRFARKRVMMHRAHMRTVHQVIDDVPIVRTHLDESLHRSVARRFVEIAQIR